MLIINPLLVSNAPTSTQSTRIVTILKETRVKNSNQSTFSYSKNPFFSSLKKTILQQLQLSTKSDTTSS